MEISAWKIYKNDFNKAPADPKGAWVKSAHELKTATCWTDVFISLQILL